MLIDRIIVGNMFTNAYVVSTGKKECVLIDPGAASRLILQRLESMNLVPQAIILTHGHIDHSSGSGKIIDHYATRGHHVPVGIQEDDSNLLGEEGSRRNREIFSVFGDQGLQAFSGFPNDLPPAEFFIVDGESITNTDLVVLHTPGHSPGSVCLYSEGRQAVFTGDTLFFNSIGRTDLPGADAEQLRKNVTERLFTLPPETRVFPGHGPVTAIEREIKNNPMLSDGATI